MSFVLDSVLANDSVLIGDADRFTIRLIDDSRYTWLVVIPKVNDVTEIYQLELAMQHRLTDLSATLGRDLMSLYKGDSLNVAAIGNVVRQLHIHHVVRKQGDAAWPGPVWGQGKALPYTDQQRTQVVSFLQQNLTMFRRNVPGQT